MSSPAAPAAAPIAAQARRARPVGTEGGLTPSGTLSLLAVVAVLVVVSVPRLRGLALQENLADARATAQVLARALVERDASASVALDELLRSAPLDSLSDAELLADGRLLRRHGYLFELTRLFAPADATWGGSEAERGLPAVRAWPWAHGRTGTKAYLVLSDGTRLEHPNDPPRWQGLSGAGAAPLEVPGWRVAR
ncbi:MAG TPA: hypothetical protein VF530_04285 [Planctomycetota bacterium]